MSSQHLQAEGFAINEFRRSNQLDNFWRCASVDYLYFEADSKIDTRRASATRA